MDNNEKYDFTYTSLSAREKREVENIRQTYLPKEDLPKNSLEYLRTLNAKIQNIPATIALVIGVIGMLIFGVGLTMILEWDLLLWGIIVLIIGVPVMLIAYPLYCYLYKRYKEKYGEEIIRISDELLKDEKEN